MFEHLLKPPAEKPAEKNFDNLSMEEMFKKMEEWEKTYYIVCLDFYTSCWGKREAANCEIIEIAAVLVDFRKHEIKSEFHEYVRPTLRSQLSYQCKNLTGITQEFINGKDPFPIVYQKFVDWLESIAKENDIKLITYNYDKTDFFAPQNHATFLIWGSWNLNELFREQCQRHSIKPPEYLKHWIDARKHIGCPDAPFEGTFKDAMTRFGIEHTNEEHSAIAKARKLASLAMALEEKVKRPMNRPRAYAEY